jgi:hypothetical protein
MSGHVRVKLYRSAPKLCSLFKTALNSAFAAVQNVQIVFLTAQLAMKTASNAALNTHHLSPSNASGTKIQKPKGSSNDQHRDPHRRRYFSRKRYQHIS